MTSNNGKIIVAGTFFGNIPGNPDILAENESAIFVMELNADNLSLISTKPYSFNTGNTEFVKNITAFGNDILADILIRDSSQNPLSTRSVWYDGTTFTAAPYNASGVAAYDKSVVMGSMTEDGNITFTGYASSVSGISDITTDGGVSVYPNPVVDVLNFSEPVDVIIYSLNGSIVKSAKHVESLNVTDLAAGLYIVKAGNTAVRVIKR